MGILNLNDVPPPLNVSDTENAGPDTGKVPAPSVDSGTSPSSMFDTSALTD